MSGKSRPLVAIVMGSDSDLPVMMETAQTLKKFGVPFEIEISSAHRSPARTAEYARTAIERGLLDRLAVGNLDAVRDFLDIRDAVRAYLLIAGGLVLVRIVQLATTGG